jgi:outer membrane protein OmpA-like peptidoglycan-associated protein/opacity protein-like surface antigen
MMTLYKRLFVAMTATTILLAATPASAQLKKQSNLVELGVYAGAHFYPKEHDMLGSTALRHHTFDTVAPEIGLRLGYLPIPYLGAELELGIIPSRAADQSTIAYGLHAHFILGYPVENLLPFLVVGGGVLGVSSSSNVLGNDADVAFHWGVGLKYHFAKWVAVRLDLRHIVSDGLYNSVHHFSALAGISVVLNWEQDTDGDGISDSQDHCPKVKGKAPSGCPDSDGDGLTDDRDKCPKVAAKTPDGCPADSDKDSITDDQDQCPKKAGPRPHGCPDSDGDSVADHIDKCPKVPANTADGCPEDQDGDGVLDAKDRCPRTRGKAPTGCPDGDGDGVVDPDDKCPKVAARTKDGCPADTDGDSIPDNIDKCPKKPENVNGYQDKDGCPDKIPVAVRRFSGNIRGIYFAYAKAKIRRRSHRTLGAAARILKKYAGLRILIRGHTDNRGKMSVNLALSLQRAEAVKAWLVKKGVAASRLEAEGVGPKEPIANNRRRRGRAKNRRIEFRLIK